MTQEPIYQLLMTVIPLVISGVVAIYTNKQIQDLKATIADRGARIARLEQALIDNHIPLPNDPAVDSRTDGLNLS